MDYSTSSSQNSKNVIIGLKNPVVALLPNVSVRTLLLASEHQHSHEILIIGASVWTTPFFLFGYLKQVDQHHTAYLENRIVYQSHHRLNFTH